MESYISLLDRHGRPIWKNHGKEWDSTQPFFAFLHPDDRDRVREKFSEVVVEGRSVNYTTRVVAADGEYVNFLVKIDPVDAGVSPAAAAIAVGRKVVPNFSEFTAGDVEVIKLLCEDHPIREIATKLERSESAVDARIKVLKQKLNCQTLPGLVATAINGGVLFSGAEAIPDPSV